MDNNSKGILFTFIGQFFGLGYWIFATIGFDYFNILTTTAFWFGSAAIFTFILIIAMKKLKHFFNFKEHWKWLLLMGLLNTGSILTGWKALEILGPSLTGFLSNIQVIFVVLFGVLILSERFNIYEIVSGIITIAGLFVMSYAGGEYIVEGMLLIIAHSIFFALSRMIIKSKLEKVDATLIVFYRAILITIFVFALGFSLGEIKIDVPGALIFITLPSIFSAVLQHIFLFKAYKLIDISKVHLYYSVHPLLVLVAAYLIFGDMLTLQQLSGGLLIMLGVMGLIYFHKKTKLYKPNSNP